MNIGIIRTTSLDGLILPEPLAGALYMNENQAHRFAISCTKEGQSVTLTGSVTGRFIRADGQTVLLTGSVSGGVAYVTLPQACYIVPGRFIMAIFNVANGATTTIYAAAGNIARTQTGTIIDPGSVIPKIDDLLAEIEAMRQATAAANAAATKAVRYNEAQSLTDTEKARARGNISAPSAAELAAEAAAREAADSDLKSQLSSANTSTIDTWIDGKYYNSATSITNIKPTDLTDYSRLSCLFSSCEPGDIFYLTGRGSSGGKLWIWTNSNGDVISRAASDATANDLMLVAPTNAAYLLINSFTVDAHKLYKSGIAGNMVSTNRLRTIERKTANTVYIDDNIGNAVLELDLGGSERLCIVNAEYNVIKSQKITYKRGAVAINTQRGLLHITGFAESTSDDIPFYWDGSGFSSYLSDAKPWINGNGKTIKFGFVTQNRSISNARARIHIGEIDDGGTVSNLNTLYLHTFTTENYLSSYENAFVLETGKKYTIVASLGYSNVSVGEDLGAITIWVGVTDSSASTLYRDYSSTNFYNAILFDKNILLVQPSCELTVSYEADVQKKLKNKKYATFRTLASRQRACSNFIIDEETQNAIAFDLLDNTANDLVINIARLYKINAVVITHLHYDHMGITPENGTLSDVFYNRLKPYMTDDAVFYIQRRPDGNEIYSPLWDVYTELLDELEINYIVPPHDFYTVQHGRFELSFRNVVYSTYDNEDYGGYNNSSLCAFVSYEDCRAFITGDIYFPTQLAMHNNDVLMRAQILQAPHHGLSTKISTRFLSDISPDVIVMNYGTSRDSQYNTSTLQRGHTSAIKVWGEEHPEVKIFDTYENNTFDLLMYANGSVQYAGIKDYRNTGHIRNYSNIRDAITFAVDERNITDAVSRVLDLKTLLLRMERNTTIDCVAFGGYKIAKDIYGENIDDGIMIALSVKKLVGGNSNDIFNRGYAVDMSELLEGNFVYMITAIICDSTHQKREIVGYYYASGTTEEAKWEKQFVYDIQSVDVL